MASTGSTSAPRSSSRSKRSTTNLSNLRLAPLSTKFVEPPRDRTTPNARSPYDASPEVTFASHHSSYIQGRSAPTTPGILSRSSSRRHLGGGLSRRLSIYDNAQELPYYDYAAVSREQADGGLRVDVGSGQIPKAKSEAALLVQQRLAGKGGNLKKKQRLQKRSGTTTPRVKNKVKIADDDWLTRTGAATNALLQESKGQSWLASRESSTSLAGQQSDDDDDDNYEEMAALSASTTRLQFADDEFSPASTRVSRWGSRYGSRSASRMNSRRGSVTALRTPQPGQDVVAGYFDEEPPSLPAEPDFVDVDEEDDGADEREVGRLTQERSFGLGGLVDRLMGFNLFDVEERGETSEEEEPGEDEEGADENAAKRRKDAKAKVSIQAPTASSADADPQPQAQGWQDAAWLLSVASKAMFQD